MSPSSRICFVGAGALGQALAVHVGAVTPATLVATPRSFRTILQRRRIRLSGLSDKSIGVIEGPADRSGTVGVVEHSGDVHPDDNLMFVTKGPQLEQAIAGFGGRHGNGWVAGLQNGVLKDDLLREAFGPDRVLGAATLYNARRGEADDIVIGGAGSTYLGEFGGRAGERAQHACGLFAAAGLQAAVSDDIESLLWTKCAHAIGIFGVTALARVSTTEMFQTPALVSAYLSLLTEAERVARACGVTIRDFEDLPIGRYLSRPAAEIAPEIVRAARAKADGSRSVSSMAQDVMAGRPTEVAETFGDLARRAARRGVDVPLIGMVSEVIGGLDDLARASAPTG